METPLRDRIDSLVCLDRGVCLNGAAKVTGSGKETGMATYFSACPNPETVRVNIETSGALAAWYGVFMSTVLERIPGPEIDIARYLWRELQFSGEVGAGAAVQAMTDRIQKEFGVAIGLDSVLLQKFTNRQPLSASELHQLISHTMFHPAEDLDPEARRQFELMQQSAQTLPREQWLATWFFGRDPHEPIEQVPN